MLIRFRPPISLLLLFFHLLKEGWCMILYDHRNLSQGKWKRCSMMVEVWPPLRVKFFSAAMLSRVGFNTISTGALVSIVMILLVPLPWMPPVLVWLDSPCSSMDREIKRPRFVWGTPMSVVFWSNNATAKGDCRWWQCRCDLRRCERKLLKSHQLAFGNGILARIWRIHWYFNRQISGKGP